MSHPSVVFPIHDPNGLIFQHLERITLYLKQHFRTAIMGVTTITYAQCASLVDRYSQDSFFQVIITPGDAPIGIQFKFLYQEAAALSQPDQILHICYLDRLAFALQDKYRTEFLRDIEAIQPECTPVIFQRSQKAWDTHPRNYTEIENFITIVSKRLFGKAVDFAWCHLAIQTFQLTEVLKGVQREDLSMVAELIVPLIDSVISQDVDWLAWEDPFIESRSPEAFKIERENSIVETQKRLAYVIAMVQVIADYANSR